jgi:hypothetical protein
MKRGKRIAFTVVATGLAVVLGLGIIHRDAVRDHVEAWHFQLTRETTIHEPDPDPAWVEVFKIQVEAGGNSLFTVAFPQILANSSSTRVIVDPGWWLETREIAWGERDFAKPYCKLPERQAYVSSSNASPGGRTS